MGSTSKNFTEGDGPLTVVDWKRTQAEGAGGQLSRLLDLVDSFDPKDQAWISLAPSEHVRRQWQKIELLKQKGYSLPLFGVPFAVKDNIDVAGLPTTAGCPDFSYMAKKDSEVVQALQAAGAVVVGKCNLDAFATGLVGTRSPYGAVPNTFNSKYISGGSSSGSASVVARGLVPFSLGTDTAGSGRVPAGLNNIIGLKATRGALSARGIIPACRSLDCVSMFTLTIEDARIVFDIAGLYDPEDSYSRPLIIKPPPTTKTPKIAICDNPPWFNRDLQSDAYLRSLEKTKTLGWILHPTDFSLLFQLAELLYEGPWVAERYAAIKDFIERPGIEIDPVVRSIIERAHTFSAADLFKDEYIKTDLIRAIEDQFKGYDAILVPTSPTFPTLEDLHEQPVLENSRLGTYTNFVNFLDWSAISIPAGFRSDGLPFGLTIISTRWQEEKLFQLGSKFLSGTPRSLGATERTFQDELALPKTITSPNDHALVIVGAHLSGFPLNHQLIETGATFNSATSTSSSYRVYELHSSSPIRKPGLKRVLEGTETGCSVEVEIWNISSEGLGNLIKSIPPPLAIGSVELVDGTWSKGFVCEPWGFDKARDITDFGGWRKYMESLSKPTATEISSSMISHATILPKGVLVANRGEIAVRIISTLKTLGVRSIAIYSQEDNKAQHVSDADKAFLLEGDNVEATYLSGESIIRIAKVAGVEAVIPGYGFLSESAEFAEACEDSGLTWIGPTPQQMRQLGLKHLARELAEKSGIPLLPGTGVVKDLKIAFSEAENIGYPVIVKSSAGGGGIGIEQCNNAQALRGAFSSMQHLSKSYFNDSRIFIERFVQNARHVEVQIIGDGKGQVKHLGERDCSLQRRKQKVIEEGPAVFIPETTRKKMREAAVKLAQRVNYRGVGTVEFIYDLKDKSFYFLEVNTRLQVEHTVTEEVTGLDLVEAMIRVAVNDATDIFQSPTEGFPARKVAIEARIYGESPLQSFRPSPGQILDVSFPEGVRVDGWITSGTIISPSYDPLLAKIIVSGYDRPEAIRKLSAALKETKISGVETNLQYLRTIVSSDDFQKGTYTTTSLDTLEARIPAFEILDPGPSSTIQDYPGRVGLWNVGIPPSGPMDDYTFRLANRVLGNDHRSAALECTTAGPILLFHHDAYVAIVGGPAPLHIDDTKAAYGRPVKVLAGQILRLGVLESGCRAYLAVKGGITVPAVFGSRSTFALGKTGGHCGRTLRVGDIIPFDMDATSTPKEVGNIAPTLPNYTSHWLLKVMPGPHAFPDFFAKDSFQQLFTSPWKVHYNSNRVGIRLNGPKPAWGRGHGSEAGLHPSNIHDSPYSIGSISFTGDQAVILTCDGPSLGGFMIFATIISSEMWKIGQMKPGDEIRLLPVTAEESRTLDVNLRESIENLSPLVEPTSKTSIYDPVLGDIGPNGQPILCRQAGDRALLLEFGNNCFDIRTSFRIYALMHAHNTSPIPGVVELTPGVRSLHVLYELSTSQNTIVNTLKAISSDFSEQFFKSGIPSRTFYLPLAFEHSSILAAVTRYSQTIRSEAPWLPSNTDFLRRINGLASLQEVNTSLVSSRYLILGLGDVFFGSPCAIPLDPRNRLFGMKYNPSRSFTPEGTVGVGGQYLCIYAIDSPGGYQLVGRTVPIWKKFGSVQGRKKWMFNVFDQIQFYSISEAELDTSREKGDGSELVRVEEGMFDIKKYEDWLEANKGGIEEVKRERMRCLRESDIVAEAMKAPPQLQFTTDPSEEEAVVAGGIVLRAGVAGKCWKTMVDIGDKVEKGQTLFLIEAMKMEIKINSPCNGRCVDISTKTGDVLSADSRMAVLSPF